MPLLISTVVMFQAQNRETINSTWKVVVLQDHDDECNNTVFHNTTPNLQDHHRFFWSETAFVLRPMMSAHITGPMTGMQRLVTPIAEVGVIGPWGPICNTIGCYYTSLRNPTLILTLPYQITLML